MWLVNDKVEDHDIGLAALEAVDYSGSNEIEVLLEPAIVILQLYKLIDPGNMRLIRSDNQHRGLFFGLGGFGIEIL